MFEDSDSDDEDMDLAPSRPSEEAEETIKPAAPNPLQVLI